MYKNGLRKFPKTQNRRIFGNGPLEMLFIGAISISLSIWYLFVDRGGNFQLYIKEVSAFF